MLPGCGGAFAQLAGGAGSGEPGCRGLAEILRPTMLCLSIAATALQEVPEVEGLSKEDAQAWRLQATLMARLPQVGMIQWLLRFQRLL